MKKTDDIPVSELEDLLNKKIDLLKCINTNYSNSIDLIESKNYKEFLEKLEHQQSLLKEIGEIDNLINASINNNEVFKKVHDFLDETIDYDNIPYEIRRIVMLLKKSKNLLKSTRVLNEKLTHMVKVARAEIMQNMSEAKNKRLIKSGYGKSGQQKTGLIFDYK